MRVESRKIVTNIKNLRAPHPMQSPISQDKQLKSCFKNGKMVGDMYLIGYEPLAYDYLVNLEYKNIQQGTHYLKQTTSSLCWTDDVGKTHRSFPDFFIPEINTFVEVKSDYTRKIHSYKIMKAKDACLKLGYDYTILTIRPPTQARRMRIIEESFFNET